MYFIAFSTLKYFLGLSVCLTACDSHSSIKGVINAFILRACPSLSQLVINMRLNLRHSMYLLSISARAVCLLAQTCLHINVASAIQSGPGSSVGIATDYGLDGPGSNAGEDKIFPPSRPALGPTQPPVKRVPGLSRR